MKAIHPFPIDSNIYSYFSRTLICFKYNLKPLRNVAS